jgi:hypothetical protein
VLINKYPRLAVRLAEVAGETCQEYDRVTAGARLAFSASYLTGRDLAPLAAEGRPFEERALAAAVIDFSHGLTDQVIPMLLEMRERDDTVADLFFTAILEECPDESELGEKLSDLAMQRLQGLPSFQRWAARTTERIRAELEAQANERVARAAAEGRAQASMEAAEAQARAAKEATAARVGEVVQALQFYFTAKGDVPSLSALTTMNACSDLTTAWYWLSRAYAGETSAEIFPDGTDTD